MKATNEMKCYYKDNLLVHFNFPSLRVNDNEHALVLEMTDVIDINHYHLDVP